MSIVDNMSIKLMLLGITIILVSGILFFNQSVNFRGIEIFILLIGFIIVFVGFFHKK